MRVNRYLIAEEAFRNVTVFEQRATVGGMWNYTAPGSAPLGIRGSRCGDEFAGPVYDELESNIPKSLMQHSQLSFPDDEQLLPSHTSVLQYLTDYAADLRHLIAFQTQVVDVSATDNSKWSLTTRDLRSRKTTTDVYDAVVVANGHFEVPDVPEIDGLAAWKEQHPESVLHSLTYRNAAPFKDKKTIVVGTGASGSEIATHLQRVCKQPVIISKRNHIPGPGDLTDRLILPAITQLVPERRAVRFANGHVEQDVDHIIFCTGYLCQFPFFPQMPTLYDGFCTRNLYRNIFYISQPTLAFVAMPLKSVPFPLSESQGAVIARVWSNRLSLPSKPVMTRWDKAFFLKFGKKKPTPLEAAAFNVSIMDDLYDWALRATRRPNLGNDGQGMLPPRWGEKEIWIRNRLGPIKAAFTAKGEARHQIKTLEQLGFDFDDWKKNTPASGEYL